MNQNDQKFAAQHIREQYMEKESTELDALRALDRKVKRLPTVLAYIAGSLGAIVMGGGMSLVMTEIGASIGMVSATPVGIIIGIIGLGIAVCNYPVYKKLLAARRRQYAPEILTQSEKLING